MEEEKNAKLLRSPRDEVQQADYISESGIDGNLNNIANTAKSTKTNDGNPHPSLPKESTSNLKFDFKMSKYRHPKSYLNKTKEASYCILQFHERDEEQ